MRLCDLSTGLGKLMKAAKRLKEQWELTKPHWRDQNAADFEQTHLQPLIPQLTLTTAAVNRLAEILTEVERDCTDRDGTQAE